MPSTICQGSRGPDVVLLQKSLTRQGYACKTDGEFGAGTDALVRSFQSAFGLTADGVVGPRSWGLLLAGDPRTVAAMAPVTPYRPPVADVLSQASKVGHRVWDDPWRLWLFGIRSPNRDANAFDDVLGATWVDGTGARDVRYWIGTTDPGTYWLLNPTHASGCAILVEGQYLDVWTIDKHRGEYDALCQRNGKVRVYLDRSLDAKLDLNPASIVTGTFGINIHAATQATGGVSKSVDKWSAGCQVHATAAGFGEMMTLARRQVSETGRPTFSYTLLPQWW